MGVVPRGWVPKLGLGARPGRGGEGVESREGVEANGKVEVEPREEAVGGA